MDRGRKNITVDQSGYRSRFVLKNKIFRLCWNVVWLLLFRPVWPQSCNKWRIFLLKCFGADIEWTTTVYASVTIWAPWNLEVGAYATLGPDVDCYNQGKITVKSHTIVSQKSYLCASSHDITDPRFSLLLQPIQIGAEVWIAAGSFIGPGVNIGRGVVVGARSVVVKNVRSWTVVGGNPAKVIKERKMAS